MKVIYFDTETTGLYDSEICQLTYIVDNGVEVYGRNYFFRVRAMNPVAESIHGFSMEALEILSEGRVFGDFIDEIEQEFSDSTLLVAHNASFDIGMMRREFERLGRVFRYTSSLCTMRFMTPYMKLPKSIGNGYKYPRLSEFVSCFVPDSSLIDACVNDIFGVMSRYHDARYDTVSLFLAINAARADITSLKEKVCSSD